MNLVEPEVKKFPRDNAESGIQNLNSLLDMSDFRLNYYVDTASKLISKATDWGQRPETRLTKIDLKKVSDIIPANSSAPSGISKNAVLWKGTSFGNYHFGNKYQSLWKGQNLSKKSKRKSVSSADNSIYTKPGYYRIKMRVQAKGRMDNGKPHYTKELPYSASDGELVLGINVTSLPDVLPKTDRINSRHTLPDDKTVTVEDKVWLDDGQVIALSTPDGYNIGDGKRLKRFLLFTFNKFYPGSLDKVGGNSGFRGLRYFFGKKRDQQVELLQEWNSPRILIHSVEIEGPYYESWPPAGHKSLYGSSKTDNAAILAEFAETALRRPFKKSDLQPFINLAGSTKQGLQAAMTALLSSPLFLYHHESSQKLDGYALASRLSYMLWCSIPDKELFDLARTGEISKPAVVKKQIARMLKDEKSQRFVNDFTWQWLGLQNTLDMPSSFNRFDKESFYEETRHFFRHVLDRNLPVGHFINADYTFVNSQLASFYGLKDRPGRMTFKKVSTAGTPRGGLLTHGSVLGASTNGVETSPVTRGVWFLEHILGVKPSPPPDLDFPEVDTRDAKSVKQILLKHQSDENCRHCHKKIDPPGFAFESFGVNGEFRKSYPKNRRQFKLETDAVLENGSAFKDFAGFRKLMESKSPQLASALVKKLLAYGTGKEITGADKEEVDQIISSIQADGYRLNDLLTAVICSKLFLEK